ncbi:MULTISPECIES: hypothetical protein [Paenibacillus]|uniref:hypothetical protein n=1 Tax=Paenibacillus TaxID=44249 RepID=UPI0022B86A6B|nr:hypothetical protein [Paenibacillus caseinilyticus]MCZ8520114.1 hypothetical protein [Paenibacillus caseinilyticus]
MPMEDYKIRIIGNACITRFNDMEAADLKTIMDTRYSALQAEDREAVRKHVASSRSDIPYEKIEEPSA